MFILSLSWCASTAWHDGAGIAGEAQFNHAFRARQAGVYACLQCLAMLMVVSLYTCNIITCKEKGAIDYLYLSLTCIIAVDIRCTCICT